MKRGRAPRLQGPVPGARHGSPGLFSDGVRVYWRRATTVRGRKTTARQKREKSEVQACLCVVSVCALGEKKKNFCPGFGSCLRDTTMQSAPAAAARGQSSVLQLSGLRTLATVWSKPPSAQSAHAKLTQLTLPALLAQSSLVTLSLNLVGAWHACSRAATCRFACISSYPASSLTWRTAQRLSTQRGRRASSTFADSAAFG